MTALLTADEARALRVGVNVIVRAGDHPDWCSGNRNWSECECWGTDPVAPQDWVALTGPCPTCGGLGRIPQAFKAPETWATCPDCRGGRRIEPLYTDERCERCYGFGVIQTGSSLSADDPVHHHCIACDGMGKRRVGRGSIEVVPVVAHDQPDVPDSIIVHAGIGAVLLRLAWRAKERLTLDPLPVPGRDWGIVIDCAEVAP